MKRSLITLTGLLVLAALGSMFPSKYSGSATAQGPSGPEVRIAGPLPLPVTGTSTVSGTVAATQSGTWNVGVAGNVNAGQSGPWNVGITGTPTFNVNNPATVNLPAGVSVLGGAKATLSVNVNDAYQPIQRWVAGTITSTAISSTPATLYVVPAGKRLVVERINGIVFPLSPGQYCSVAIITQVGGWRVAHTTPPSPGSGEFNAGGVVGEQLRVYADPGTEVSMQAVRTESPSIAATIIVSFSGYLVDVP